jgi:phage terminase large subunit-like protein
MDPWGDPLDEAVVMEPSPWLRPPAPVYAPAAAPAPDPLPPRIHLTADMMAGFLDTFLLGTLDTPTVSPPFHHEAWEMVTSDHPQVALAAPRGHAKSTAITLAYVLAMLLFRATPYAVVVSNTRNKAIEFVRNLKDSLMGNESIRHHFKVRDFTEKDSQDDFICTLDSGYQFRVTSIGFGTSVRGLNWGTRRPGLVMMDDAEDDEQVMSQDRREKAMSWLLSALMPAMSPTGLIRVVGTILHVDSILQNLINDEENWLSRVWAAHDDNFENILWPERYSREKLLRLRQNYIRQGRLENYNMEYRNKAVDTSSGYFQLSEFLPMTEADKDPKARAKRIFYASGDFAISKKARRDYTVLPIVSIDYDGTWYVEFVRRARMDGKEIIDELYAMEETFNPQVWFLEDGTILKGLKAGIDAEAHEQRRKGKDLMLLIEELTPVDDKMTRARGFQRMMRGKRVKWDTEADWFPDVQQEILEFPRGLNDDVPDAFATLALGLDKMVTPSTPQEELEEEWEERRRQGSGPYSGGRNKHTGY